jgi:H+/Cl- antiporter ClcA
MLVVVNVILGCGFAKGLVLAKDLFEKHANKFWSKYFGFALFAIALVLNFLCLGWMGSGAHIIEEITHFNNVWLLIALLAFRFIITIFAGTDRVTGGVVIPMLTLGAIGGQIVALVCNKLFGLSADYNQVVIIISMAIIFTVVNKTPITSSVLFLTAVLYAVQHSAENISVAQFFATFVDYLPMIAMTTVAVVVATFLSKLIVKDGLYHMLMHVDLEHIGITHPQAPEASTEPVVEG